MVAWAVRFLTVALSCGAVTASAQTVYTYVGQITATSVLIAWGTTRGGENTIGRDSTPLGAAQVRINNQTLPTPHNWIEVTGLRPDTVYPYEVDIDGRRVGGSAVRTWPAQSTKLTFFVIGDYGNASGGQRQVAELMTREFQKRAQSENPPRFVLTLGDNIYADVNLGYTTRNSGAQDKDWESKFFQPYRDILQQIPFLPTVGNHDGNASENRADLTTYLDNFFFPENRPSRWYEFDFGGLVDFFGLDSSDNSTSGHPSPIYAPDGEESRWLAKAMGESKAPWKIPYFHHPPFNAGPGHGASYSVLRHWVDLFQRSGVRVVFTGHEHNFQFSELSEATGRARYIVSGAGGELRSGNVMGNMARAHMEGWAAIRHFLIVEIDGMSMRITPVGTEPMVVRDGNGREIPMPLTIDGRL